MRVLVFAFLLAIIFGVFGAPQRTNLQTGPNDADEDGKPYIEEVVVESVLQVRNPNAGAGAGRSGRTNTQLNLKDGARVAEMKRS